MALSAWTLTFILAPQAQGRVQTKMSEFMKPPPQVIHGRIRPAVCLQMTKEGLTNTLLIVDDNQENLYMLRVLLSANGFKVESASNGAEALELARRSPPDMIISDILMPVMDGFSLCRAWKEDERLKKIPFVFYTATYTAPQDEDFALSLGADRFIIKPVEPDRFMALIRETCKNLDAGKPVVPPEPVEQAEYYKEYNAVLIRKLEDKMLQLEEANRNLECDISERKRIEEELRKSRNELELRVQERTAELEIYMKKLQQTNQDLQDFVFMASHDIKEPLRKITAFGNILERDHSSCLGGEGKDCLDRMLNATERMQSLLKSLLDYSRVTRREERFTQVDLGAIVKEVLSDLETVIEKTGAKVQVSCLPTVEADPTDMRQLLQNLIGNALKYHREASKPIVKVSSASIGTEFYEILVEDNGIGFEEKHLDRIFAPFQRLHGRSSQYEGTGIGLAICHKIVERHRGIITARSTPGAGTTFTVKLPVSQ